MLEGTDGSGKGTQTKLLVERLQKEGQRAESISFPCYGQASAAAVELLLKNKFDEDALSMSASRASLPFALDRAMQAGKIKRWLDDGKIVIADRYVDSNAAHQGSKIKDLEERKKFIRRLYAFEYEDLQIPRPNLVLVLKVFPETANKLIDEEGKTRDAHEASTQHIIDAYWTYLWIVDTFADGRYKFVECMREKQLLSKEEIHERIWKEVKDFLGKNRKTPT